MMNERENTISYIRLTSFLRKDTSFLSPWSWPVRNRNAAAVNIETSSSRNVEEYLLQPGSYFESIWPPIFDDSRRNLRPSSTIYMHFHYNKQIEELPERPGAPECSYFLKTGHCKFKSNCKFHHPKSWIERLPPWNLNDKGLPLRPERRVCRYYGRYRICKFGRGCMFHHPQLCKISSKAREHKLTGTQTQLVSVDVAENGGASDGNQQSVQISNFWLSMNISHNL